MNKENFEVGKKVEIEIFWYDEDGNKFLKKVNGIIMKALNIVKWLDRIKFSHLTSHMT